MRKAFLLGMLVWGLALAQGLPRVGFMEAVRAAQAWSRIPTPAEEISLSWSQGQPRYAVDLAKGRRLLQVYVDGMTGRVLGAKPLRERALGARAWLREPPGVPLGEAVKSAQKALKTREFPEQVAYQIWGGRPVLRMDFSQVQAILDARTGAYLGQGPRGR